MNKKIIKTEKAPQAIGPYSQATKVGNLLFISGQLPLNPAGNMVEGNIENQTKQVLENLKAVIEEAQMDLSNVLKCSCFLNNMNDFLNFNKIYAEYFQDILPARECIEVARLPKDALVEISAICFE